jgi:hypothetical protein
VSRDWGVLVPVLALVVVGGLALLLRWAFSRGGSVVARSGRPGAASDYGLLVAVAAPRTVADGEELRQRLERAGVRANVADTADGPRLMVFERDVDRAKSILTRPTANDPDPPPF